MPKQYRQISRELFESLLEVSDFTIIQLRDRYAAKLEHDANVSSIRINVSQWIKKFIEIGVVAVIGYNAANKKVHRKTEDFNQIIWGVLDPNGKVEQVSDVSAYVSVENNQTLQVLEQKLFKLEPYLQSYEYELLAYERLCEEHPELKSTLSSFQAAFSQKMALTIGEVNALKKAISYIK